jgi:CHAT domain-containing protein/Tfp pilus assembly protein PilF
MGCYSEAEPLYKKSLEINEKALGKDHPELAINLNNLATLYLNIGRFAEAEPLYKRSLEIRERVSGNDHPDYAASLNNLALFYIVTDRHAEAEVLSKRSLEINEKVLGKDSPEVAISLDNLARVYSETGRYDEAESMLKRSIEIKERLLEKDPLGIKGTYAISLAISLNNMGTVCGAKERYDEAESLLKRSLEINEKIFGEGHVAVARMLENLSFIYGKTGKYSEVEPLLKRALDIREKVQGKDHPDVGLARNGMAILYAFTNRHFESHRMFVDAIAIEEKKRGNIFLVLSERQKLNYMKENKWIINGMILHAAQHLQKDNLEIAETFDAWFRWKGAVMEAQQRYIDALSYSETPEIRKKFEELNNTRRQIARLQLSGPEKTTPEEYKKRLEELEKEKESLEADLSGLSKDFALEKTIGKADIKKISEILQKGENDSVYVDFAHVSTSVWKGETLFGKEEKVHGIRYLVFILLPDKEPKVKLIDLSEAEKVDSHVRAYLEEINRAKEYGELPRERILKAEARALYELLLKPIEAEIRGKKHLYISPDGNLNLIPFEVLMTPEGKYLMEDYNITYIAAGRDIIRFMDATVAKGEPVIMADPDYDMGLQEKVKVARDMGIIETRGAAPLSRDAKDMRFKRLPDTKQEANAIEGILKEKYKANVRNYQDKKALEEVLFKAKEPRVLHLATHGYFLRDEEVKTQPQIMGFISQEREKFVDPGIENPMLRSGIVLAGVNASLKEGRDDGVVSAEKILGLRLKGTDLVVLSACETGVGDVKSGEGVFGLKRSFILSGAKTVVMSLWSVPSKETTELMTDFYTLMAKGKTKAEAFREARLNLMKKKSNPFYWGAFIMVGNPN